MSYPERLLGSDETVVSEFRPHWSLIVFPMVASVVAAVALVALGVFVEGATRLWSMVAVVVIWLILVTRRLVEWWFTQHVITTERVIHRAGFISKKGKEIPLEVINDVAFTQTALERILGSGDLLVESAGEEGQSLYHHIPDPEGLQSLIYRVREDRMMAIEGGHRATSTAEQLQILAHLHDEGRLSDEEFETEKSKLLGGEQPRPE